MHFTGEGHTEGSIIALIAGPGEKEAGSFQSFCFSLNMSNLPWIRINKIWNLKQKETGDVKIPVLGKTLVPIFFTFLRDKFWENEAQGLQSGEEPLHNASAKHTLYESQSCPSHYRQQFALVPLNKNFPWNSCLWNSFSCGKIARWQSNPEWFALLEHENYLSPTVITQHQTRKALNFTVYSTKPVSNKNEVLAKISERDSNLTGSFFLQESCALPRWYLHM